MKELHTAIDINASAERVWQILTDFAAYPAWNPFIRQIEGRLEVGARLSALLQPSGTGGMRFRPTLLAVEQNRELRWLGSLFVPKLFDGEHRFLIEHRDEGGVQFVQSESFSGLLVPFFSHSLATDTRRGFEEMNLALRERAEAPE